jgi:hypothetical protein
MEGRSCRSQLGEREAYDNRHDSDNESEGLDPGDVGRLSSPRARGLCRNLAKWSVAQSVSRGSG